MFVAPFGPNESGQRAERLRQNRVDWTSQPTANRVLALLSAMFNKGRMIGWEKDNPYKGVEKFAETSRERFLNAEEVLRQSKETPDSPVSHQETRDSADQSEQSRFG